MLTNFSLWKIVSPFKGLKIHKFSVWLKNYLTLEPELGSINNLIDLKRLDMGEYIPIEEKGKEREK